MKCRNAYFYIANEQMIDYYSFTQDKIEKLKASLVRLEAEKRALQEELSRTENRSTKLELQRMSAEGDLQRLQMMIQEKDASLQVIINTFSIAQLINN